MYVNTNTKPWERDNRVLVATYHENYCLIRRYSSPKSNSTIQIRLTIRSM